MRKLDWTDFRNAIEHYNGDDNKAVNFLCKEHPLSEINAVKEEWQERSMNDRIEEAMARANVGMQSFDDTKILRYNGARLADVIRKGGQKK